MAPMQIQAIANHNGLSINGQLFNTPVPLAQFEAALGHPAHTIAAGPPAPYGHRNNQIHCFEEDGIYLIEDHATWLVGSVNFVFDLNESPFRVETIFTGELVVDGQRFRAGMSERDLDLRRFERYLPGRYYLPQRECSIIVGTMGKKVPGRRRGKLRYLTDVSVSLGSNPAEGVSPD